MPRIKAIIFDLDDTLFDCTGSLTESARRRAARAMVGAGLPMTEQQAYDIQTELVQRYGPRCHVFDRIAEKHGLGPEFVQTALEAYNSGVVEDIKPFPDVIPTLTALRGQGYLLFLVTMGVHKRQEKKIDLLGIRGLFDEIIILDRELGAAREECYMEIITRHGLEPQECAAVGDRVFSEIRVANHLKMVSVQMIHGRFKSLLPKTDMEEPDYKITRIAQLPEALAAFTRRRRLSSTRVLAIGGGTGLPIVIEGLKQHTRNLTAIVTTTDSGRSSGVLRRDLGVMPPGDARNCLVAMAGGPKAERLLYDLFQFRFGESDGVLKGMSFGNLFIAALERMTGGFESALHAASQILAVEGKVLPATLTPTHICARLADGAVVREEFNVRGLNKPPIAEVFLE
ncbi:MAG TPA: 2-phospho-L-lactate transferase CofD family protein, partial [Candidatus Brocadiia bacterium]|nr:2-phospho-L-lactate transferase CofD family protein [Candidatus Brocadiia bacterium]